MLFIFFHPFFWIIVLVYALIQVGEVLEKKWNGDD